MRARGGVAGADAVIIGGAGSHSVTREFPFTGPLAALVRRPVAGKPAWGTQFHSEMNVGHMRERLMMYRDAYLPMADAEAEIDRILRPSPHADTILGRFLGLLGRDASGAEVAVSS